MATGGNAIRGTRVGAGPMGEQDHGHHADRVAVSYWDALGNETVRYFAAGIADEEIPEVIDSPHSGLPAGRDKANPPALATNAADQAPWYGFGSMLASTNSVIGITIQKVKAAKP